VLHQIIHHADNILAQHFVSLWFFSFALVIVVGWLVSADPNPASSSGLRQATWETNVKRLSQLGWADGLSGLLFIGFAIFYFYLIFYREDFSYYDDDLLTDFSLQGKSFPPPIWTGVGRFYPLADQEFNLLSFLTRSPFGYHALVVLQLIILIVVLFLILREFRFRYRCLIAAAAMMAPSFLIPFMGFVYPERNVLFGIAILILCLQGYYRNRSRLYLLGALGTTHFILYYKETVVLFVVTFAFTCMLLQLYQSLSAGPRSWRMLLRENVLPLGMLGVAGIYTVVFLIAMLPHRGFSYVNGLREPLSSVLVAYLQFDWLPFLLLAVVLFRIGRFLFTRLSLDPLWDPLAIGAIVYFLGILALRINSGYYMAPVDFLALFCLANLSRIWLQKQPARVRIFALAAVVICLLIHNAAYSSFRVVERKRIVITKVQLADFLRDYLPSVQSDSVELFFPYSSGYHLMDLASFLSYKGFRLEGQGIVSSASGPKLAFKGRETFDNDKCVGYRDYSCRHAENPSSGALVIILPDDAVSMEEVRDLAQGSSQLLFIDCPECSAHRRWFDLLHTISAEYSLTPLPGHWLQLHVFLKPI
jgi:hypothetical protein